MADYIKKIRTTTGDKEIDYEALANKPNSLPNPNKIKFTGSVVAEYDGSSEVTVDIPNGASEEQIRNSVNEYLDEHPVTSGATEEQATQIQTNTNNISELKKDLGYSNKLEGYTDTFKMGRYSTYDGVYVESEGTWVSTTKIVLMIGDEITVKPNVFSFLHLAKYETNTPINKKIADSTGGNVVIQENGIYNIQGCFLGNAQVTDELIQQAKTSVEVIRYKPNLWNNSYIIYSNEKLNNETETECLNRLLEKSSAEKKIVLLDKSIIVDSPIIMKKGSTLYGNNSTKTYIKAGDNFVGDAIIIIDTVNSVEIGYLSINGGCIYDWNNSTFSKLGAKTDGILVKSASALNNVTYCRLHDISIYNVNGIGFKVVDTTYEGLYTNFEIKCCIGRGIYCSGTDSNYDNFIIGNCGNETDEGLNFGVSLQGSNNNFNNFKIYLSGKNYGLNIYSGSNNNFNNFNIQDCPYCGLGIRGGHNNNFNNFTIDRCSIAVIMTNTYGNYLSAQCTWSKGEETPCFSVYRSIENIGSNYVDIITEKDESKLVLSDSYTVFGKMFKDL